MEQRLAQAQEQMLAQERQAIVAELAGAAAHELNQPLTSVMGYAELLKRRLEPARPRLRRRGDHLQRGGAHGGDRPQDSARSRATRRSATSGKQRILDLDRASEEAMPVARRQAQTGRGPSLGALRGSGATSVRGRGRERTQRPQPAGAAGRADQEGAGVGHGPVHQRRARYQERVTVSSVPISRASRVAVASLEVEAAVARPSRRRRVPDAGRLRRGCRRRVPRSRAQRDLPGVRGRRVFRPGAALGVDARASPDRAAPLQVRARRRGGARRRDGSDAPLPWLPVRARARRGGRHDAPSRVRRPAARGRRLADDARRSPRRARDEQRPRVRARALPEPPQTPASSARSART